jgi:hypothetical protein
VERKKPITLLMPAGGLRQAPRADATFMLVEYQTEYQLRFGRKIKKVPGVGMASFWVEGGSEAGRFVEQGFPPATEQTRALYAPLLTYYGAKLTGGGVGFSGIKGHEGDGHEGDGLRI